MSIKCQDEYGDEHECIVFESEILEEWCRVNYEKCLLVCLFVIMTNLKLIFLDCHEISRQYILSWNISRNHHCNSSKCVTGNNQGKNVIKAS